MSQPRRGRGKPVFIVSSALLAVVAALGVAQASPAAAETPVTASPLTITAGSNPVVIRISSPTQQFEQQDKQTAAFWSIGYGGSGLSLQPQPAGIVRPDPNTIVMTFTGPAVQGGVLTLQALPEAFVGNPVNNSASNVMSIPVSGPGPGPSIPSAPVITAAIPGGGSATVTFTPPASDGGSPITAYEYRLDSGAWISVGLPAGNSFVITPLVAGTTYRIALRALNAVGVGEPSTAVEVTPRGPEPTPVPVAPLSPGQSALLVDDSPVPVDVAPNASGNGLLVTGESWTMTLDGLGADGLPLALAPGNVLVLDAERDARASGAGFLPGSQVGLFMDPPPLLRGVVAGASSDRRAPEPVTLGLLDVSAEGAFTGTVRIPDSILAGSHELQAVGFGPRGDRRVLTLGIVVRPWIELVKGPRTPEGANDRIRATGDTGGLAPGSVLKPYVRTSGQTAFAGGTATVRTEADGTFAWTRLVKKSKGITAYFSDKAADSNRVTWPRRR